MKMMIAATLACTFASAAVNELSAQPRTDFRPDETVLLYGEKLVDNTDPVVAKKVTSAGFTMEESNGLTGPEEINESGNIGNINVNARFDLYFPKKPNGQMVIVCPGGGYSIVSSYNEGVYVAEWLAERGITAAIVKYRLPNGHWNVPLADIQNTFRYCRANAGKWGIDQIGVMGFSAGGHLAVTTSVMYADAETRPDFSVFIYPVVTFDTAVTHMGTHNQLIGEESAFTGRTGKTWEEWNRAERKYSGLEKRRVFQKIGCVLEKIAKNKPDFLEQYVLGKSGLFYRGKAEHGRKGEAHSPRLRRSIKIVIWRLLSHSNFGAAGFRTTNPIVRRKKSKAGFLKIP